MWNDRPFGSFVAARLPLTTDEEDELDVLYVKAAYLRSSTSKLLMS